MVASIKIKKKNVYLLNLWSLYWETYRYNSIKKQVKNVYCSIVHIATNKTRNKINGHQKGNVEFIMIYLNYEVLHSN